MSADFGEIRFSRRPPTLTKTLPGTKMFPLGHWSQLSPPFL